MSTLDSLSLALRRWRQFLANRGAAATVTAVATGVARRLRPAGATVASASELWRNADQASLSIHPFDAHFGTDTSGLIWGENLRTGHHHDTWNTAYYGIAPSVFEQSLGRLRNEARLDWTHFTFIDLGSGKGRAVLLASREPFARIVGIELSPELHATARTNLDAFTSDEEAKARVTMLHADAADFPWESALGHTWMSGDLLFFLYNPFSRPVLEKFLKRLQASLQTSSRRVYFLFINPELDAVLTQQPWIEKLWQQTTTIGEADQAADRFGSTTETAAAYQAHAHKVRQAV